MPDDKTPLSIRVTISLGLAANATKEALSEAMRTLESGEATQKALEGLALYIPATQGVIQFHYENDENATALTIFLDIPFGEARSLLNRMRSDVNNKIQELPFPFDDIWYPAWNMARQLLRMGKWDYDHWLDLVDGIVELRKARWFITGR